MDIVENLKQWRKDFEQGWLAYFQKTGQFDWKSYTGVKNSTAPSGSAVDLSQSRLVLISTAGGYLPDSQKPFDAPHPIGDYSIRLFPSSTPLEDIAYSHDHYDHAAVNEDPQVLLPLRHLEDMVNEGAIGELAPSVISFSGYHPDVTQVVNELIPPIVDVAITEQVDAALLVPA